MPGKVGVLIRYLYARRLAKACGDNVLIGPACTILHWKNLELGNNVALHERSYVDAIGGVSVGNDVSIAHATSILSFEHTWTNRAKPIKYNDLSLSPIAIASDTWIGCGVRILAGACIGERTVIAAGAVVPKGCYKAGVFAGVPARLKKAIS
ncbi:acyltransferase [Dyella sp. OK004]|uniref:acyltransferase n=1 Tax=Dyella sp. OK004 TaxID=1855292 RepID=UPI000B841966|nr:acyltransferase [Dyella sp. OK004]